MRKYLYLFLVLFLLLSSVSSLVSSPKAYAVAGPVGLNGLRVEPGPGVGQITLNWFRYYSNVDNYSIAYGTQSGVYPYGAANIGNVVVYTIGGLTPGTRYFFYLYPFSQGNLLTPVSPEISEVAATAPRTVMGTAGPYGNRSITAVSGPASGQVTLTWTSILPNITNFSLVYGLQPGVYQYGALNIAPGAAQGTTQSYTVSALVPGVRYYFGVVPMQGGQALYSSAEVSQVAHR